MKHLHEIYRRMGILQFPPSRRRKARPIKTQHSATVFGGQAESWVTYLDMPREDRYDGPIQASILLDASNRRVAFQPLNQTSLPLTSRLNEAFALVRQTLAPKPLVTDTLDSLLFHNQSNGRARLFLRSSSFLPSEASREIPPHRAADSDTVNIVLRSNLIDEVMRRFEEQGQQVSPQESIGLLWPIVRRLISQIGFPSQPRDRFLERIHVVRQLVLVTANLLYDGVSGGLLVPNAAGRVHEYFLCQRAGISEKELYQRHPYFRMLNELRSILLDTSLYQENKELVDVMVREYLDQRYLRLSLSGVMPAVTEVMAPMLFRRMSGFVSTPYPRLGQYGILDRDDLRAWKHVEGPFRDMGFTLLRQLGMGQFGRVYEALNPFNPGMPERIALKVDRIIGSDKNVIQDAEAAMQIGRDLASSPHVIRVYDAGKLSHRRLTYHVLQVIDGDTLDNLAALAGKEHSSINGRQAETSEEQLRSEYDESILLSRGEGWRRRGIAEPFTDTLSLGQLMDLQTSILLWLEKIHSLGYVVNDLKNGNLMVSRRGQLKGIDLDAYSPIRLPIDTLTDFLFLATSTLLFLLHLSGSRDQTSITVQPLLKSRDGLYRGISDMWAFGDVEEISHGRVQTGDVIELLTDMLSRSRNRIYTDHPDQFSADIDRWIHLKRDIFIEEMVLD